MVRKRQLFILVSQTQTGIARLIRGVCKYPYNHVSVTLDPSLNKWYSFARYVQDAPLHGGLVSETPERLCAPAEDILIRVYRVEIPEKKAEDLEKLLRQADNPDSGLIYNHYDAVASACGIRLALPGCHTCLSFACEILGQQHLTIKELCDALEPNLFYQGPMTRLIKVPREREGEYFAPVGVLTATARSAAQLGKLTARTISHGYAVYLSNYFRRTVH